MNIHTNDGNLYRARLTIKPNYLRQVNDVNREIYSSCGNIANGVP